MHIIFVSVKDHPNHLRSVKFQEMVIKVQTMLHIRIIPLQRRCYPSSKATGFYTTTIWVRGLNLSKAEREQNASMTRYRGSDSQIGTK